MNNYIGADLRRIFRKQSFLWAFGAFAGCFAILVFIYFNPNFTAEMYVSKMTSFMSFFSAGGWFADLPFGLRR